MTKTLLYIGRFQPFTSAHQALVLDALGQCEQLVIGLGSCNQPPSARNPFSVSDREWMVRHSFPYWSRASVIRLPDFPGNHARWILNVCREMDQFGDDDWAPYGNEKDETSFYLKIFPERPFVPYAGPRQVIDATSVRELFFRDPPDWDEIRQLVPVATYDFLRTYQTSERWKLACRGAYL